MHTRLTESLLNKKKLVKMKFLIVFFAFIIAALAAPQFGGKFNYKVQNSRKVSKWNFVESFQVDRSLVRSCSIN